MPLPTTHAFVPLAGAIAFGTRPLSWRLILIASIAAAAPDLDSLTNPVWAPRWGLSTFSIYAHRGAAHSLFVALAAGLVAAMFHKYLGLGRLTAALGVGAAMASHGILDMMTDAGRPIAYLWPLSPVRFFVDWRPLHSSEVAWPHFCSELITRQEIELWQVVIPMFAFALAIRMGREVIGKPTISRGVATSDAPARNISSTAPATISGTAINPGTLEESERVC